MRLPLILRLEEFAAREVLSEGWKQETGLAKALSLPEIAFATKPDASNAQLR
jgi:hypothetical protein